MNSHQPEQPNTDENTRAVEQYAAQRTGEALDGEMAALVYEAIRYAHSLRARTWYPQRCALFEIANQFPQN